MTKSRRVRSADRGLDPRIANDRTKFATEPTVPGADPTQSDSPGLSLDVNLRLGREIGILFGPSGSGKSTLLRLIAGLARPSSGMVRLDGSVLFDSSMGRNVRLRDRRVGMIFQDDLLFPHRSVAGNVRFGLHGWASRLAKERVAEVSELCGISGLLDRDPSTLSGGERQRVGLARALAPRPRLLLCDEPVSALDLDARHALIDRIGRVQRAESIPVLYVTHSPVEAIALGSRLFLLSGGRIAAEGSPIDVLAARDGVEPFRLRNTFRVVIERHDPEGLATTLRIVDGPQIVVARIARPAGTLLTLSIEADEIVLAKGPIGTISARNLIDGTVDRVVRHGPEAEVLVRTGGVSWVVGVVPAAVESLGLIGGSEVRMIVKSRSCRVLLD